MNYLYSSSNDSASVEEFLIPSGSSSKEEVVPIHENQRKRKPHERTRVLWKLVRNAIIIAFAFLGLIGALQQIVQAIQHHYDPRQLGCDCGNSTAEAIARGCKFDSLAIAWLPDHCRDDELTAEFEHAGPGVNGSWGHWADFNHTKELTLQEVSMLPDNPEAELHMTWHWHVVHCLYYWRKEHRAKFNGKIVEPRSDRESHSKHCLHLIQRTDLNDTAAEVALQTND